MEKNMKAEEVLTAYRFENTGQYRAIVGTLGYAEEYNKGSLRFTRSGEEFHISVGEIRNAVQEGSETYQSESKKNVCMFFDKEQASKNFEEYSQYLKANHNISIVKWDGLKGDSQKAFKGQSIDGFTIIDHDKKVCYTGKSLYEHAFEHAYQLDGKGSQLEEGVLSELKQVNGKSAKLRLNKNGMEVYYRKEALSIPNEIDGHKLSKRDKELLRDGKVVLLSKKRDIYLQVDRDLNSVVVLTNKEIKIPSIIGKTKDYPGYVLTPADKFLLANGHTLENILVHDKKNGYLLTDFSLKSDRKGVVFTNSQSVTEGKAQEILQKLNESQETNEIKMNSMTGSAIDNPARMEQAKLSITPEEKIYLNALIAEGGHFPKKIGDKQLSEEEQLSFIKSLGFEDNYKRYKELTPSQEKGLDQHPDDQLAGLLNQNIEMSKRLVLLPIRDLENELRDAISRDDFNKVAQLKEEGFKPSEHFIAGLKQDGNLSERQSIAINKIFGIETDLLASSERKETIMEKQKETTLEGEIERNVNGRGSITPEEQKYLQGVLNSHGAISSTDKDAGASLGLQPTINSTDEGLSVKVICEANLEKAKELLQLPIRSASLDDEFKKALAENNFVKISELKDLGYKPSSNLIKTLSQEGTSPEKMIAIQKVFGLQKDKKNALGDVKLAEGQKGQDLTRPVANTIGKAFSDL